jgi:acyl-CoA dehydrogenase
MNTDIFDAVDNLLGDLCTAAVVKTAEDGGETTPLWTALQASGFSDALVPEALGGAGLGLADAFAVAFSCGRWVVPLPWAHTIIVRGAAASHGVALGEQTIAIASHCSADQASGTTAHVPFGLVAEHIVVRVGSNWQLWPSIGAHRERTGGHGSLDATLTWATPPAQTLALPDEPWLELGALVTAALIAGALERSFEITTRYANERVQFGKPVAKIQVIQQHLSVMAEHVFAARMAAQIGWNHNGAIPRSDAVAVAKQRTSEAVTVCAPIAHAVHGAMGFTAEYDLQRYTRRLHEWRLAFGSEGHWAQALGQQLLARHGDALDMAREIVA